MSSSSNPIDDTLLALVKAIQTATGNNPEIIWITDRDTWLLTINNWTSYTLYLSYEKMSKKCFSFFTKNSGELDETLNMLANYMNIKEVIDGLFLLKFHDKGVSNDILKYLAEKFKTVSIQEAVDSISKDTMFIIEPYQMTVMNINVSQRGKIVGRNFGLS